MLCNFFVQMLQYFFFKNLKKFAQENMKKLPSKVAHNQSNFFFSNANPPKSSPNNPPQDLLQQQDSLFLPLNLSINNMGHMSNILNNNSQLLATHSLIYSTISPYKHSVRIHTRINQQLKICEAQCTCMYLYIPK